MQLLASLVLLAAGAALEIGIAPDQPLPFVYVDDPLIIELRPDADARATVRVEVKSAATGKRVEHVSKDVLLRAGGNRWLAIEDLPRERGYYSVAIRVAGDGVSAHVETGFCRIERPSSRSAGESTVNAAKPPFAARHVTGDRRVLLALRGIGIGTVQTGLSAAHNGAPCEEAARLGFRVLAETAGDAAASQVLCSEAAAWVLRGDRTKEILAQAAALRAAGVTAPLLAEAASAEFGVSLIEADGARLLGGAHTPLAGFAEALPMLREAAEARGHEAWSIWATQGPPPRLEDETAVQLLRDSFTALAAGASGLVFDDTWIFNGEAVGPWMAYCGALSRRMTAQRYAGRVALGKGVSAPLFRDGSAWFLPVWTDGAERQVTLPLRGATDLAWTDALNNPLDTPAADESVLTVMRRPRYLTGRGGALLAEAARSRAVALAQDFVANARYGHYVPEALHRLIAAIAENPEPKNARNRFFQLIRFLPELESQWHAGTLPGTIATPAIAHVARLARPLCALEEAGGAPFLEPLADTLLNCEEYQSLYLTGSVATSLASERGDWLMREVQRLTEEARRLAEEGRDIEAAALAALAEWRARALVHAAKAGPLSNAAQELPIEEPAAAPPAETEVSAPEVPEVPEAPAKPETETPAKPDLETPPVPVLEPGQPEGTRKKIYTVKRGDNPDAIARKFGVEREDFLKWNKLGRNTVIHINDELIVYVPIE